MAGQRFRWQAFFQRADEPLFLLSRKRSLIYVNPSWEKLTGFAAADVRSLPCRRRQPASSQERFPEMLGHLLSPPPEVLQGQFAVVRRIVPTGSDLPRWWDLEFTPLLENRKLILILGRIRPQPVDSPIESPVGLPLPERLLTLRFQAQSRHEIAFPRDDTPAGQRLGDQIRLAASITAPAILVGEPGTGKRTIVRLIHKRSKQAEKALVVLDCERLPATFIADQLLGNAYRLQESQLGTIYLREPAALPGDIQHLLQQQLTSPVWIAGPGRPRFLAGFDQDPLEQMHQGRLLQHFFFSLSTLRIDLEPLRRRLDELPLLIEQMLQRLHVPMEGKQAVVKVSSEVMELLRKYTWPGNLSELLALLEESQRGGSGDIITLKDLPYHFRVRLIPNGPPSPAPVASLDAILEQVERRLIQLTLERCRGNKSRAADELGMSRARFLRRLEHLGLIDPPLLDMIEE